MRASSLTKHRRMVMLGAAALFIAGVIYSWMRLPTAPRDTEWALLVVAAVIGVPLSTGLNASEYLLIARVGGATVRVSEAYRIAILSTAANIAPLPGGVLIRWGDLTARGVKATRSLRANAVAGTISFSVSGLLLALLTMKGGGLIFIISLAIGISTGVLSGVLALRAATLDLVVLVGVEMGIVLVTSFRAYLILSAFGLPGSWQTSFAIASTYALASAIGVFPSGLGIREALAGVVTRGFVDGVSTGFLVSAVDRLLGLAIHAPLAVYFSKPHRMEV